MPSPAPTQDITRAVFAVLFIGGLIAGSLSVNGRKVAEGRIEKTQANIFSWDDAADVRVDEGTPVTKAYKERDNKFIGKNHKVTIDLKEMRPADAEAEHHAIREASARKRLAD
jgi:arylsulfatase